MKKEKVLPPIPILKKGGIHIKKKNRGKFTEYCGGKVTEECIRKGKNSSNPTIRKRSTFAANARKWKHENGGIIRFQPGGIIKLDEYGYPTDITPAIITQDSEFNKFLMTLPDNLRLTPEKDYHMYAYWKLSGKPENFKEGKRRGMFTWDRSDKGYHAGSIAEDRNTGIYHFMKPKHHPTVKYELDWFNKGLQTLEGGKQVPVEGKDKEFWEDFTSKYQLDTTGVDYRYVPIKKNGGIIKYQNPSGPLFSVQPGSPIAKALEVAKTLPKQTHQGREIIGPDGQKHFIRTEAPIQPATSEVMSFAPGVGDAMEVAQIGNDVRNGNYGTAALATLLTVLPGNAGKILNRTNNIPFKVIDLNGIKKVNVTLEDPSKYWYVAHQTTSDNFPSIYQNGLRTNSGLNGTALHVNADFLNHFANGRLREHGLSHKLADGLVIMKFPKSEFPSADLDDISIRLMDSGKSKSFEVPNEYLQFFKRDQFRTGGKL